MYEQIYNAVESVDNVVWGWGMIILLLGTHLFLTIRTGFIQRKTITKGIPLSVSKEDDADGEVSQFGALATALASTIGTGNIIGVGTAIALGGPGAVLWCWLTGVFGIATKYAESLIAVKYRVKTADGRMQGGAMYALERGLNMKWLGMLFAVFAGFASFGIGCATQVNAIAEVCSTNLGIEPWIVGLVIAVLTAFVIFGGIKSIASVCEKLVPFMAFFYVLGCIIILCIIMNILSLRFRQYVSLPLQMRELWSAVWSAAVFVAQSSMEWQEVFSPTNPAWVQRRLRLRRQKQEIRCARRLYPLREHSGIRLLSV